VRVLHIGKYFPPYAGGMETYLRDLMTEQSRQGMASSALVHRSELSLTSRQERYSSVGETLPVTRAAVWARLLFTPISPTFPLLLWKMIRRERPDILHLHMPNVSAFWALILPSARRIPWVVQWQSDVLASRHSLGLRLFYRLYRPFERAVLRRSATIIASSPPYLESSEPLAPFINKCVVVPLGLDPAQLAVDLQTDKQQDTSKLRVLAIGRLTYYKGFEHLIRAAAAVDGVDIRLVGSGELDAPLKRLAKELGVDSRINFLGHLSDAEVAREYAASDCLCLPSIERTEAYGLVLLEAMYFGKATVISDVPGSGMGWIVDQGRTGLKVPVSSAKGLADAFRQLRSDRDTLARLGEDGRRKFDQQFHISQTARQTSGLYAQSMEGGRRCSSKG
jgi:glycosyltransferase involved in cell wall biosynthesis